MRRSEEVSNSFWGFVKPMLVLAPTGVLILLQPDFGTTVVLFADGARHVACLAVLKLWQFSIFAWHGGLRRQRAGLLLHLSLGAHYFLRQPLG